MKIGIDARLWNETGVGRYIRNLVYNLAEIDDTNDYVLFVRDKDHIDGKWLIANGKWKIVETNIRWHTIEEQIEFPKILNKENLDLVHFPYFSIPVGYNRPYVITIHDLILNHFSTGKASTLPPPMYHLKRLGYKYVLSTAIKKAEKIIVPLNAIKEDLVKTQKVSPNKIIVTYEGFDHKIKTTKKTTDNKSYFLYVGNAYPHKNLDRLIKAFRECRSKYKEDLQLVLVGKEDYFYKKLIEKINYEDLKDVVILNNLKDEDLAAHYQNAIALVAPSLMEGFGLPVLEAMASSCLVIASDIPSFNEVAKESAIYFNPNSVDDIQKKMIKALELTSEEKKKYTDKGLSRAGTFSWKTMAEETLKIYEDTASVSSA